MDFRLDISPHEVKQFQNSEKRFYVIDIRGREAYEEGHIPGALSFPEEILLENLKGISPETLLVLYCDHGVRSKEACIAAVREGFTNVKTLQGGYTSWVEE